jgi:hypothetical protein
VRVLIGIREDAHHGRAIPGDLPGDPAVKVFRGDNLQVVRERGQRRQPKAGDTDNGQEYFHRACIHFAFLHKTQLICKYILQISCVIHDSVPSLPNATWEREDIALALIGI